MVSKDRESMIAPKIHLTEARRTQREKKIEFLRGPRALRASVRVSSLWFLLLILLSCQTAPKIPDISLDQHLPFEPGAFVYVIAEKDALPIVNQFMFNNINNKQLQQMIDRTQSAAAAVYMTHNEAAGTSKSRYRLAAWGSYPSSGAKMALGSNKEWKKMRSPVSHANYWYSAQNGLSLAITAGMALAATSDDNARTAPDPFPAAPWTALPEGFAAFREGSILSCWLDNPGPVINVKFMQMNIPFELPAEQIFVNLFPADDQRAADEPRYTAHLQIQVAGAIQARALTMMFALARNFIPLQTDTNNPNALLLSVLFANPPEQDGANLKITTAPLSVREIALLLKIFSV